MKRIIAILCICLLLTGCGTNYKNAKNVSEPVSGGYFTMIKKWDDEFEGSYMIVYANDTKVKYLMYREGKRAGITPLYNTDGSLQLYEEDKEDKKEGEENE